MNQSAFATWGCRGEASWPRIGVGLPVVSCLESRRRPARWSVRPRWGASAPVPASHGGNRVEVRDLFFNVRRGATFWQRRPPNIKAHRAHVGALTGALVALRRGMHLVHKPDASCGRCRRSPRRRRLGARGEQCGEAFRRMSSSCSTTRRVAPCRVGWRCQTFRAAVGPAIRPLSMAASCATTVGRARWYRVSGGAVHGSFPPILYRKWIRPRSVKRPPRAGQCGSRCQRRVYDLASTHGAGVANRVPSANPRQRAARLAHRSAAFDRVGAAGLRRAS